MDNLKPFDTNEIDETLTRVVTFRDQTWLLFPYVSALGSEPVYASVSQKIAGASATVADFEALSAAVLQSAGRGEWCISFNTPWLLTRADADPVLQRASGGRHHRV